MPYLFRKKKRDACPEICHCTTSFPHTKFSGTKHWATRLVILYIRLDSVLYSSIIFLKERKSKEKVLSQAAAEWKKDKSFRAMVNGERENPPCPGACVFPRSGGRSDTQQEQICFHNEKFTQLLSSLHHRGVSSGRLAVKNSFLNHIFELEDRTTTRKKTFPSHVAHLTLHPR